jgi:Fic family protein
LIVTNIDCCYNEITNMIFHSGRLGEKELSVLERVDALRKKLGYIHRTPQRWYGLLRRNIFAKAIQGSNSIEGYVVTAEDAIAAVQGNGPSVDQRTEAWQAISGYQEAMTYVLQKAEDAFFVYSSELLKALHYMMVKHDLDKNPGRWRPGTIYVRRTPSGEIVYEGPDVALVPSLIDELVINLKAGESDDSHVIIRAAMAHLNLAMIHPFSDGNGRMGRCLQTLILARDGVTAPLFSSIEEYLGRNTEEYYRILGLVGGGSWHPENDVQPWIRLCLTAHYRQAETLLRRTRTMERVWDEAEVLTKRLLLPERCIPAVADATLGLTVTNASYRGTTGVSDVVARNDLRELSKRGILNARGEKRGRYYVASDKLVEIGRRVSERKSVPDPFEDEAASQPTLFAT